MYDDAKYLNPYLTVCKDRFSIIILSIRTCSLKPIYKEIRATD